MTKLLDRAIEAIRSLPDDCQDAAGEVLLAIAGQQARGYALSPAQAEDVRLSLAGADRGEFATDADMAALWKKCGQ